MSEKALNWENLESVKEFALRLGRGLSVIKYKGRTNYNICHTCNETDRIAKGAEVIYKT